MRRVYQDIECVWFIKRNTSFDFIYKQIDLLNK